MDIKPIETYYNGYRFRSRLEARWAVFFDAIGVEYEYEPEGFVMSNGEYYLPDFFLPKHNIYVEVKHGNEYFINRENDEYTSFNGTGEKYAYFTNDIVENGYGIWFVFGDPMTALLGEDLNGKMSNDLFANGICSAKVFHKMNKPDSPTHCKCNGTLKRISECEYESIPVHAKVAILTKDFVAWSSPDELFGETIPALPISAMFKWADKTKIETLRSDLVNKSKTMLRAIKKARQARFEHGETPRVSRI